MSRSKPGTSTQLTDLYVVDTFLQPWGCTGAGTTMIPGKTPNRHFACLFSLSCIEVLN